MEEIGVSVTSSKFTIIDSFSLLSQIIQTIFEVQKMFAEKAGLQINMKSGMSTHFSASVLKLFGCSVM